MSLSSSPGKQTQLSLLPSPSPTYFASESLFQEFSLDTSSSVDIYQVLTLCKNLCLEEQKMPWAGEKKRHSPCPHGAYGQNKEEAFNSAGSYTVRTEKGGVCDALRMWDSRRASLRKCHTGWERKAAVGNKTKKRKNGIPAAGTAHEEGL